MPRVRKRVTGEEPRHKAFRKAVMRSMADNGYSSIADVAAAMGVTDASVYKWMKGGYSAMLLDNFRHMVKIMKFTPQEVCEIIGVKYE